ncbi:IQ and AAA domain-containing protein 1-like isoform X2 [Leptopilina boulardi]|uniref:IQ and AAA domain-containing protein 1-like isoform X2 n=1 Tax=Leptopilina boulardi TaxID=63433 RepID=UPI0021F5394C|nr:IQ and AAA domain-containing protein 1-like isoform X2 [Leptopilina boulardi]
MSESYYSKLWLITQKDVEQLLELDEKVQANGSTEKKVEALNRILPIYLKYRNIVKRLTICHDQVIQVQKRNLIKQILNCAIIRMLEYKREIVNLDYSEYHWPDNFMIQMKLTPDDLALTTPACFTSDRKALLEQRKKYIEDLIANANAQNVTYKEEIEELSESGSRKASALDLRRPRLRRRTEKIIVPLSKAQLALDAEFLEEKAARLRLKMQQKEFFDAILLIQKHERARVARSLAKHAERQFNYENKLRKGEIEPKMDNESRKMSATITIQKAWRSYLVRKSLKKKMNRLETLLGMTIPSWKSHDDVFNQDEKNFQQRLALQPLAVEKIEKTVANEKNKLWKIRGPGLMEDITDEIREWFLLWYGELGYFDVYPNAEAGGSILMATGQTQTPEEYAKKIMEKKKNKAQMEKEKTTREKKKGTETEVSEKEKKGSKITKSQILPYMREAIDDFIKNWSLREETENQHQTIHFDLINDELCYKLQLEMREIVDEIMRVELNKLVQAVRKDNAGNKEKLSIMPEIKKEKKRKKMKKRKKDPLSNVPVEELFKELALANIIRYNSSVKLQDWIGDLSYANYEAQREFREYSHRLGEIKQLIMEYCILPLGSKQINLMSPQVKSVCICGLSGYGKTFLANAISSECGALVFDLTPSVLIDKYTSKKNEKRLMNIIEKVSRVYAPSIIFIDGGEKPWWKKIPPEEKHTKPKRLAKLLTKFVKGIKPGDQILFLTLTSQPYNGGKAFIKIHDKFIIIPVTDYNSLFMFYQNLLMKYHGIDRNIDISCLAKVSIGLPLEFIRETIEKVLNLKRRSQLLFKPLDQLEIMEQLLNYNGPGERIIKKFKEFEFKTPLGKKRITMILAKKEERERIQKMKNKRG